ncbi:MAG: O-succinylhomoserine sulfhydrylase [Geminicoccaceae bacterium]|nr:O-succinylhomoserine sulfhydrylase [Geminicoccaceae bacterium]MCX7630053.1 O-succinylhomoserine sulfhydrylase [Geminicoccaceae bacterium]MDW8123488.1 O-succinylhomoserine sulfhydrylase [Geminicoccaceae bacterium]
MSRSWGLRTRLVHGGAARSAFGETSEAIFLTSGFVYASAREAEDRVAERAPGYQYSRIANPTVRMLEERFALLEGAEDCAAVATGMAAVHAALFCQLRAGARVVASAPLFGACQWILTDLLPRFGVESELVPASDGEAWERALSRPAAVVLVETPANPTLELVDVERVARLAKAAGAALVVDNAFATPFLQRPLALGADLSVYSATKLIDGQGRCLGGLIAGSARFIGETLRPYLRNTGPALSPFNAWVLLKGLETLSIRIEAQQKTARALASWLEGHPAVVEVRYPGLPSHPQADLAERQMLGPGTMIAIRVGGGRERAFAVLDRLRLIKISNNLGDVRSLATHPATTTHAKVPEAMRARFGITEDLLRISVGLEDAEDLVADLDRALRP